MGKKKAFIVTDNFLYNNGYTKPITDKLDEMGIVHKTSLMCLQTHPLHLPKPVRRNAGFPA